MANRDSFDRSSSELVSTVSAVNGSALKEVNAPQIGDEGLNEYHHSASSDDLSPAVEGVLKSDVGSNLLLYTSKVF